jgi:hypothetical protein
MSRTSFPKSSDHDQRNAQLVEQFRSRLADLSYVDRFHVIIDVIIGTFGRWGKATAVPLVGAPRPSRGLDQIIEVLADVDREEAAMSAAIEALRSKPRQSGDRK